METSHFKVKYCRWNPFSSRNWKKHCCLHWTGDYGDWRRLYFTAYCCV